MVSFTQKTIRRYHLEWLNDILGNIGTVRSKANGVSVLEIVGIDRVKPFLLTMLPWIRMKVPPEAVTKLQLLLDY